MYLSCLLGTASVTNATLLTVKERDYSPKYNNGVRHKKGLVPADMQEQLQPSPFFCHAFLLLTSHDSHLRDDPVVTLYPKKDMPCLYLSKLRCVCEDTVNICRTSRLSFYLPSPPLRLKCSPCKMILAVSIVSIQMYFAVINSHDVIKTFRKRKNLLFKRNSCKWTFRCPFIQVILEEEKGVECF